MQNVLSAVGSATPVQLALLKRLYSHTGIDKRQSIIEDYIRPDPSDFTFFPTNWSLEPFPTTARRMAEYENHAVELAAQAAQMALDEAGIDPATVTHLVISTCTGFFAPGPDVLLLRRLGIPTTATRVVLGFMGCYAGISGIRACHQAVQANPDAVVLQVAVELCSLHYQNTADTDIMVANAIFADGASAAVFAASSGSSRKPVARVIAGWSDISPDSTGHMSWRIGDHGFLMQLDAAIPGVLQASAPDFVRALANAGGCSVDEIAGWAIHPGGRKIVDAIQQGLGLSGDEVASSLGILRENGNMSSATILFVLKREIERLRQLSTGSASPIAAMAFGPGLTMEGALLAAL